MLGNLALHHLLTNMDALLWIGAVRMRVQTVDKNNNIIHTQLQSIDNILYQVKIYVFETNP